MVGVDHTIRLRLEVKSWLNLEAGRMYSASAHSPTNIPQFDCGKYSRARISALPVTTCPKQALTLPHPLPGTRRTTVIRAMSLSFLGQLPYQ